MAGGHREVVARKQRGGSALKLVGLNPGVLAGYGLVTVGLVILLVGLVWSAARRLRNLSDDPQAIRVLIVGGLGLAAAGVVVGALATIANGA
jgi:hypothetical protein